MTGQAEIHFDAEPECPGFEACPVVMCGCRFLYQGSAWKESPPDDREPMRKSQEGNGA